MVKKTIHTLDHLDRADTRYKIPSHISTDNTLWAVFCVSQGANGASNTQKHNNGSMQPPCKLYIHSSSLYVVFMQV